MARDLNTSDSGGGWAIAVVATSTLMVIFLILTIVLYVNIETYRTDAERAQSELRRVANSGDLNADPVQALLGGGGGTVVGRLLEQRAELIGMTGGDPTATLETVRTAKQRLDEATGMNLALIPQGRRLQENLAAAANRAAELERQVAQAQSRARRAEEQLAAIEQQFRSAENQMQARLTTLSSTYDQSSQRYDARLTELNDRLGEVRGSTGARVRELQSELAQAQVQIGDLERRLKELVTRRAGETGGNTTPADGVITTVNVGTDIVFINRGRADLVFPGMTFEVFDETDIIKLNEFDELRGKATIEVFDVGERTARARVVRRGYQEIVDEEDVIANLVYDPNMTFTFYVFGEFDLDGDGIASAADQRKVEAMVTRFGGRVAEELTYEVDYLVLGNAPPLPEPLPPGEIDPVRIETFVRAQREYEAYNSLVQEASQFNIPVLNQNRFLSLVGFYRR